MGVFEPYCGIFDNTILVERTCSKTHNYKAWIFSDKQIRSPSTLIVSLDFEKSMQISSDLYSMIEDIIYENDQKINMFLHKENTCLVPDKKDTTYYRVLEANGCHDLFKILNNRYELLFRYDFNGEYNYELFDDNFNQPINNSWYDYCQTAYYNEVYSMNEKDVISLLSNADYIISKVYRFLKAIINTLELTK